MKLCVSHFIFGLSRRSQTYIFLDVGLMSTVTGLNLLDYEKADVMRVNAGAVCEQYIGQHLLFSQHPYYDPEVYYWIREKKNSMVGQARRIIRQS